MVSVVLKRVVPLAAAAVLVWGVAPALSVDPYLPEAVDFETALPRAIPVEVPDRGSVRAAGGEHEHGDQHRHAGEGPVRFITPPVEAPRRFDLVGVAGEMEELEYRIRADGGEWSRWAETADGNPVYAGGADWVQVRSRDQRPRGDLHFVNVSGTDTPARGLLTAVRKAVNSAFISVASTTGADDADASSPKPDFVGRRRWGANRDEGGCRPRTSPEYGKVKAAVVHHTATSSEYSRSEAPGIVLGICRFHRNANGWNDIGYNAIVDRFGTIYKGRQGGMRRAVVGAHTQGYNSQATAVASIGNHVSTSATPRTKRTLVRYLAWKLDHHELPPRGRVWLRSGGGSTNRFRSDKRVRVRRIFTHRDVSPTQCAGARLIRKLPGIRGRTKRRMERFAEQAPSEQEQPGQDGQPEQDEASGGVGGG